ncbi:MAG: cytochrome c oxidase assembly protein [Gammaproteobacteria bacterium]|nr:cytochrome c oxidase assembly protein [Gammaproteobacteria bacterium]
MQNTRSGANRRLALKLMGLTALMFGFGYALVPLYDVFCEVTGLNGKTGELSAAQAEAMRPDLSREVTIEFVTSVTAGLGWEFKAPSHKLVVHPGVVTAVEFEVVNREARDMIGQAIPSVAPSTAARYFSKTECFCFSQQPLVAGKVNKLPVRFVVDPRLPANVDTVTLGYTFFEALPGKAPPDKAPTPSGERLPRT